jgi:hypothetical protein
MRAGKNVSAFSHKVNTAEDDVFRLGLFCSSLRQFKRVSSDVSELNYLIALVVMSEYENLRTENGLSGSCSSNQCWITCRGEFASAGNASLGGKVSSLAQEEQVRQRCG